jgi:diphthamide synthase (EF-2-diphthine--ammonia ligase)
VDRSKVASSVAGREYDLSLLNTLPATLDPCGENGEFHTFVFDGPIFRFPIAVRTGEIVERDSFLFCDLLPAAKGEPLCSAT